MMRILLGEVFCYPGKTGDGLAKNWESINSTGD